jgi:hypothetical protein
LYHRKKSDRREGVENRLSEKQEHQNEKSCHFYARGASISFTFHSWQRYCTFNSCVRDNKNMWKHHTY